MTDEEYYEVLLPETRRAIDFDLDDKIQFVLGDKFIPYKTAEDVLQTMDDLLQEPRKSRMTSLVVYGDRNNGKTSIIQEFVNRHPPTDGLTSDPLPVIDVEAPGGPDIAMLYNNILDKILIPYKKSHALSQKQHLIKHHSAKLGTRMLVIDEINNILAGSASKRVFFMNSVKGLANQLNLNIVVFGISTALLATSTDDQIQSRFRPIKLPKWLLDEEYTNLLASLELTLPFKKHPRISTNEELATKIFDLSGGVLGYVVEIVNKCAVNALKKGKERVNLEDFKGIDFINPSELRALAQISTAR